MQKISKLPLRHKLSELNLRTGSDFVDINSARGKFWGKKKSSLKNKIMSCVTASVQYSKCPNLAQLADSFAEHPVCCAFVFVITPLNEIRDFISFNPHTRLPRTQSRKLASSRHRRRVVNTQPIVNTQPVVNMQLAFHASCLALDATQSFASNRTNTTQLTPLRTSTFFTPRLVKHSSIRRDPQVGTTTSPTTTICSAALNEGPKRDFIRVAIPSKGTILEETKDLLSQVGVNVQIKNPRQYVATMRGVDAEVWLQRPADIVRKVRDGDVDLGFTGYDLVAEYGGYNSQIVSVHERLAYGECRLAVGVPMSWNDVTNVSQLAIRSQRQLLRIATKYSNETARFFTQHGISNYRVIAMDGALEASTQMGTADCIVDLVSSGVTLRENLLKEIDDGTLLNSSMQLIGNRKHLAEQSPLGDKLRTVTREILERIEAYLLGKNNYNIIANIRGSSMVDVSRRLATQKNLRGVDGPTISPVVPSADSDEGMYAISIVVPKDGLYSAIQQLRSVGGSGVTVLPVSFIFPQSCSRWDTLIRTLHPPQIENPAVPVSADP